MSLTSPRLSDLSKAIVAHLNSTFGEQGVAAVHNSNVVYTLPQLATLRVDCWPATLERPRINRLGRSRVMGVRIAIQKRVASQDESDTLTDLADSIVDSLLDTNRFMNGAVYCDDCSFTEVEVFDRFEAYQHNVFLSIISASFVRMP